MGAQSSSNLDDILAEDMHHWYKKFMKDSPSGLVTLFELKTMLSLTGMTEEASSYVDQVFYTFDMDGVKACEQLLSLPPSISLSLWLYLSLPGSLSICLSFCPTLSLPSSLNLSLCLDLALYV